MHNFSKLKSIILSGALAVTSVAAPFSAAVSPTLTVNAAGNDNYAKLLQYSLYFYDGNMCGNNVDKDCALSWRGNCHTDDEVPGGYHDAGDHAMFGLPQGWASSMIGWAYYEYPESFDSLGLTDHFKTIFHHFTDFYKASTVLNGDSVSRLLYQKGDGNADHKYWGAPEAQGGGRQMFWTNNGSSDVAAHYAATLAQDYMFFGDADSLKYAKALYKFSKQYNQVTSGGHEGFYSSEWNPSCKDEQAWAAGWMYLATKEESYKNDCVSNVFKPDWTHSWGSSNLGASIIAAELTGNWDSVLPYISSNCSGGGYLCMDSWGSARYNCGMQFFGLIAQKNGKGNFSSWAQGQMDFLLGNNPNNVCFVAGYANNSPTHYHHRASSGMTDVKSNEPNRNVLVGALIGGPNKAGYYADNREEYETNEVALDYQANLVCAAAALYSQFKTGSVDTNIAGVGNVNLNPVQQTTQPPVQQTTQPPVQQTTQPPVQQTTQPPVQQTTQPVVTTQPSTGGNGTYTIKPGTKFKYSTSDENDRMLEFSWMDLGMKSGEVATKVEFNISTNNSKLGKWVGAFGTGTSVAPDYWYMSDEETETFNGNTGTVTWNVPSDVAKNINYNRSDCPLKFGIWYIEGDDITVDSVTVYTSGGSSSTPATTQPVVTTTKATTTTTTTQPPQTQPVQTQPPQTQPVQTQPVQTQPPVTTVTLSGDANCDRSVNIADAVMIMQAICNPSKYGLTGSDSTRINQQGWVNADCCNVGDGVTNNDALAIQKYTLSIVTSLPTNS